MVICGFGPVGETVARFLTTVSASLSPGQGQGQLVTTSNIRETKYVAFDLDPDIVIKGFKSGKRVLYGDGSQPKVLTTAGIEDPQAFVVTYSESEQAFKAVERLRLAYPSVPILSRYEYFDLKKATYDLSVPIISNFRLYFTPVSFLGFLDNTGRSTALSPSTY